MVIHRVQFNGERIDASEALISPISQAALYGKGVFTTIRIVDGQPFLPYKHWRRLSLDAAKLGIDLSAHSSEDWDASLRDLIAATQLKNGRIRVSLFDASEHPRWWAGLPPQASLMMMMGSDEVSIPDKLRLGISPYATNSRSPLAGIKSCNYLENLLAYDSAKQGGFDEAVRLNERGEVTSACMANIFWTTSSRLFTPHLNTGCLPGTTREHILEKVGCEEVAASLSELETAQAIFLSSAGLGIRPVRHLNGRQFEDTDHPILKVLPF